MNKYLAYHFTIDKNFAESLPAECESAGQIHLALTDGENVHTYALTFEKLDALLRGSEFYCTNTLNLQPSIFPLNKVET